ncbi:hypothetical protein [Elstera cyanobacteriorum]|uniref:hypothetical protein n=1 Tax=Elstera cyanobacteriorum TaxID=2022747 RepID=UPI001F319072|nr:hypothetical protein [Elstera cyanobacteriorum]
MVGIEPLKPQDFYRCGIKSPQHHQPNQRHQRQPAAFAENGFQRLGRPAAHGWAIIVGAAIGRFLFDGIRRLLLHRPPPFGFGCSFLYGNRREFAAVL